LVADESAAFGSRRRALAFQAEGRGFEPRLPLLMKTSIAKKLAIGVFCFQQLMRIFI